MTPRKEIYKTVVTINGIDYIASISFDLRWKPKQQYRWTIIRKDLSWSTCGQAQIETGAWDGLNEKVLELSKGKRTCLN